MPLFPLDRVRVARFDQQRELDLEEVAREVRAFDFPPNPLAEQDRALEFFEKVRPLLNVLAGLARPGERGIDISTGLGFLPVLLQRAGMEMVATERNPEHAVLAASHNIPVLPFWIGDPLPAAERSFDVVFFSLVLEYVRASSVQVIEQLVRLLRPAGRFILVVPNIARLANLQALAAGETFLHPVPVEQAPKEREADHLEHVRDYSTREVVEALEAAGLEVRQVVTANWGPDGEPRPNAFSNDFIIAEALYNAV
ncbi:MAG: class I SAM-dependent methyltransferase [Chloroflexota bacterium]